MKRLLLITSILIFIQGTIWAEEFCSGASCMPNEVKSNCTTMQGNGCIDWSNGVIYATGMGVPMQNVSQAQKRYSALEAARLVAMRNLLQMVEGINISSTRTVKAGMLENDTINTQINGRIRQVIQAGRPKEMSDGSVWVTMKMYLRDIMSILIKNEQFDTQETSMNKAAEPKQEAKKKEGPSYGGDADTVYTGLIIDARGVGISPAMSPKVYNTEGKEIYGSAAVDRDFVLQHGIVGYVKDMTKAQQHQRVKGNPLIIKAHSSEKATDLTISNEDASLLEKLDASQSFLREARVLIIVG
jgi:hypothetical protein